MKTGILLTNLGTPAAPTAEALRSYLAQFLSDPRVVQIPRLFWYPILHGIILRTRPAKSAEAYQRIWTAAGSPLMTGSQSLAEKLQARLPQDTRVVLAMRYGEPSIAKGLQALRDWGAGRILILPLYPQYAAATVASTYDAVHTELNSWQQKPEIFCCDNYCDNAKYIEALANSIKNHWQEKGSGEKLFISFHGIPQATVDKGDPYQKQCFVTADALVQALGLQAKEYEVVFQSRFGAAKWLQPYCSKTLELRAQEGLQTVDVTCPGFAVDCLETLDEIANENRELFIAAGGKDLRYIPALNDTDAHVDALLDIMDKTFSP